VWEVIEEDELRNLSSFSGTSFTDKDKNLGLMEHVKEFLSIKRV